GGCKSDIWRCGNEHTGRGRGSQRQLLTRMRPAQTAVQESSGPRPAALYHRLFPWGLWENGNNAEPFASYGAFAGDTSAGYGAGTRSPRSFGRLCGRVSVDAVQASRTCAFEAKRHVLQGDSNVREGPIC